MRKSSIKHGGDVGRERRGRERRAAGFEEESSVGVAEEGGVGVAEKAGVEEDGGGGGGGAERGEFGKRGVDAG